MSHCQRFKQKIEGIGKSSKILENLLLEYKKQVIKKYQKNLEEN